MSDLKIFYKKDGSSQAIMDLMRQLLQLLNEFKQGTVDTSSTAGDKSSAKAQLRNCLLLSKEIHAIVESTFMTLLVDCQSPQVDNLYREFVKRSCESFKQESNLSNSEAATVKGLLDLI
jgi:hypothetical protein